MVVETDGEPIPRHYTAAAEAGMEAMVIQLGMSRDTVDRADVLEVLALMLGAHMRLLIEAGEEASEDSAVDRFCNRLRFYCRHVREGITKRPLN